MFETFKFSPKKVTLGSRSQFQLNWTNPEGFRDFYSFKKKYFRFNAFRSNDFRRWRENAGRSRQNGVSVSTLILIIQIKTFWKEKCHVTVQIQGKRQTREDDHFL